MTLSKVLSIMVVIFAIVSTSSALYDVSALGKNMDKNVTFESSLEMMVAQTTSGLSSRSVGTTFVLDVRGSNDVASTINMFIFTSYNNNAINKLAYNYDQYELYFAETKTMVFTKAELQSLTSNSRAREVVAQLVAQTSEPQVTQPVYDNMLGDTTEGGRFAQGYIGKTGGNRSANPEVMDTTGYHNDGGDIVLVTGVYQQSW